MSGLLKRLRAIFAEENVKEVEESDGVDIGHPWGLRGAGEEGIGVTTRDELRVAMPGMIWDNGRLERTVVLSMLRSLRCLETVKKVRHWAVAGDGAE